MVAAERSEAALGFGVVCGHSLIEFRSEASVGPNPKYLRRYNDNARSGGVGVASVQLGAACGHTIVALSRSAEKQEQLKRIGGMAVFNPTDPQWGKELPGFLKDRRVDLAIDNIGGALLPQMIDTLGHHGRVSIVGRLAGPVPQFNSAALIFRRLRLGGVAVGAYGPVDGQAAWKQIVETLAKRDDRPLIDHVFPFDQLPAAFERLAKGPMGKVLLAGPQ